MKISIPFVCLVLTAFVLMGACRSCEERENPFDVAFSLTEGEVGAASVDYTIRYVYENGEEARIIEVNENTTDNLTCLWERIEVEWLQKVRVTCSKTMITDDNGEPFYSLTPTWVWPESSMVAGASLDLEDGWHFGTSYFWRALVQKRAGR